MPEHTTQITFHSELSHNGITRKPKPVAYREEAQSLIELAVGASVHALVLGSTEIARFAWASVLTSNAARAGAQYGAQNPITAIDIPGIKAHAASDSVNLTGLTTTPTLTCACSNGNAITNCISGAVSLYAERQAPSSTMFR